MSIWQIVGAVVLGLLGWFVLGLVVGIAVGKAIALGNDDEGEGR